MSSKRNPNARDDWQTPRAVLDPIEEHWDSIGLDPATVKSNPTNADRIRTPDHKTDGLETEWLRGPFLTFVNPPYRKPWYDKIIAELRWRHRDAEMIALLQAKPGTGYFQDIVELSDRVCFVRRRLTFVSCDFPAPFESALIYAGDRAARFERAFSSLGWIVS